MPLNMSSYDVGFAQIFTSNVMCKFAVNIYSYGAVYGLYRRQRENILFKIVHLVYPLPSRISSLFVMICGANTTMFRILSKSSNITKN